MSRRRCTRFLFLLLVFVLAFSTGASAKTKYKNKWVKKKGYYYYYNNKGKKSKGITKIGKKKYYFDSQGRQGDGWRYVNGHYYFFTKGRRRNAYMRKNRTVNGIYLDKKGRAVLSSERAANKAAVMAGYQIWLDELTGPRMSKEDRLLTVFDYLRKTLSYHIFNYELSGYGTDWDIMAANYILSTRSTYECWSIACAFAYLANAIGYDHVTICAHEYEGGHAWVEIGGKIYDASLARNDLTSYRFFATTDRYSAESPIVYQRDLTNL